MYLTVAELWECQKKLFLHFISVQLYKNLNKEFIPFIYYLELKLIPLSPSKRHNMMRNTPNEYNKTFWKVKIGRINSKDSTEQLPLDEHEGIYQELIIRESDKIVKFIKRVSKSELKFIRLYFLINNTQRKHYNNHST